MKHVKHNRLLGPGLLLWAVDHIRAAGSAQVTLWSLNRSLCEQAKLTGRERERQYKRMATVVRNLEASGLITTRKEWDGEQEKYHKIITLCSEE